MTVDVSFSKSFGFIRNASPPASIASLRSALSISGEEQNRSIRVASPYPPAQFEAVGVRQPDIQDVQVELLRRNQCLCLCRVWCTPVTS